MCCDLDLLLGTSPSVHTLNKTSLYLFPLSSVTLVSPASGAAAGEEAEGATGEAGDVAGEEGGKGAPLCAVYAVGQAGAEEAGRRSKQRADMRGVKIILYG